MVWLGHWCGWVVGGWRGSAGGGGGAACGGDVGRVLVVASRGRSGQGAPVTRRLGGITPNTQQHRPTPTPTHHAVPQRRASEGDAAHAGGGVAQSGRGGTQQVLYGGGGLEGGWVGAVQGDEQNAMPTGGEERGCPEAGRPASPPPLPLPTCPCPCPCQPAPAHPPTCGTAQPLEPLPRVANCTSSTASSRWDCEGGEERRGRVRGVAIHGMVCIKY